MKLRSISVAILVVTVIFGGITATTVLGLWQTSSTKVPATFKQGEWAGVYDPADIRGSYTFGDIAQYFKVQTSDLAEAFGVPGSEAEAFQVKNLESIYADLKEQGMEVGTSSVRLFVAWYIGLPFDNTEQSWLPEPAITILKAKGGLTYEQLEYVSTHAVTLAGGTSVAHKDGQEADEDKQVKGKTTFHELLSWGLAKDTIEEVLGKSMPQTQMVVRDYCSQNGLTFSTVKEALQQKLDALGK